ncbi:hypothetical protein QM012_004988 [Aureobasidium pullulans]|uniref:RRM domain-containing protein n=1 Tax=Aureobasidium pullulans TaxID=5580 RepID=A0ABR0T7D1_AURPU
MAPATITQKVRKEARKHQRARGSWASPFPQSEAEKQKRSASIKVTKITSKPYNPFKSNEELLADFYKKSIATKAEVKLTSPSHKARDSGRASHIVTAAESFKKTKARRDSLSPFSADPKPKPRSQRTGSGTSFESRSSSATTSVRGVHLLLAIIPPVYHDRWLAEWKDLCSLYGDNIEAYYSSIETADGPTGLKIYADCENKLMGNMLKNKLHGDKVLNKKLICEFI